MSRQKKYKARKRFDSRLQFFFYISLMKKAIHPYFKINLRVLPESNELFQVLVYNPMKQSRTSSAAFTNFIPESSQSSVHEKE